MTQIWRFTKRNGVIIIFVIFMLFVGYEWRRFFYGPRWFANLEKNAQKAITAEQLQAWGTNLVVLYQTNENLSFTPRDLGTNFPTQLLSLSPHAPYEPIVQVFPPSDADSPGFVLVFWTAGAMFPRRGFAIGPPDFVYTKEMGVGRGYAWQPGVYFFGGNKRR